jgi:hypothetical protein
MKKTLFLFFLFGVYLFTIYSCAKTPVPCFRTDVDIDSIHVHQPITFSTVCTRDGSDFNWEFYGNGDSIEFGPVVVKSFPDTGNVKVYLLVLNGKKSSSITSTIHILP